MSKVQCNPNNLRVMSEPAFVSGCVIAAFLYATDDPQSVVESDGYFDNHQKYIKDNTVVLINAGVGTEDVSVFSAILNKVTVPKKGKRPERTAIKVSVFGQNVAIPAVDPAVNARLDALEAAAANPAANSAVVDGADGDDDATVKT